MKKILFIILISVVLITLAVIYELPRISSFFKKEVIYIALAGPMNHSEGKAMQKGVDLYIDKINKKGGIEGRKVELLVFNDKNDSRTALKIASEISRDKKTLLVIGHFYTPPSTAAGELYKKNGIPAITASATAGQVTLENEWYFRVVPNNRIMVSYLANYIKKVFQKDSAVIISSEDSYGSSLAVDFEKKAKQTGIEIKMKRSFSNDDKKLDEVFRMIVAELRAMDDPGMIFLATRAAEGAEIITMLKNPGTNYSIIGPDSFSTDSFIDEIRKNHRERTIPGYYSDGIYAISPVIPDIASRKAYSFRQDFVKKYNEEPSWISSCYYDAARIALEAVERAEVRGRVKIREDRRSVRESLASMNNYEVAVKGVIGNLFFDANGDVTTSYHMGIYDNQKFLPSFLQYQLVSQKNSDSSIFQKSLGSKIIIVDGKPLTKTEVVYTGIDINEISEIDIKNSKCAVDFLLWFRFQGKFNEKNIKFTNSLSQVRLDQPVLEETTDGVTVRTYHVKADFEIDFDFRDYPFGHQKINISFRHDYRIRNNLIFVPDLMGLQKKRITAKIVTGWKITDISSYQDITGRDPSRNTGKDSWDSELFDSYRAVTFSLYNTAIQINEEGLGSVYKTCFSVIFMLLILYLIYYIPYERLGVRALIFMSVAKMTDLYSNKLLSDLGVNYMLNIGYVFLAIYLLTLMSAVVSVVTYIFGKRGQKKKTEFFTRAGKAVHTFAMSVFGILLIYLL
ncbi:MAG: ABC transporter substrate-binding protein [Desulfobacterales bacterium]|nr:ABC transporter substrate-binding protein [Desulfobacterales bacterium]